MSVWSVETTSADETHRLGRILGEMLQEGQIVLLCGDLGAGKTCLSQGIGRGLGLGDDVPVTSPSYTLMNQYAGRLELHHFDLYRLGDPDELIELGVEHYLGGAGVSIVEWADRFELPCCEFLKVTICAPEPERRQLRFEACGAEHCRLLETLAAAWDGGEKR